MHNQNFRLSEYDIYSRMAQYYLKTENDKIILYICEFDWNDIYKIAASTDIVNVKVLTTYTTTDKTEDNSQQFWERLIYMDSRFVHPDFEEMKKGQPLSTIRQILEGQNLNVYEYDVLVKGVNVYSYYHDDAIIEIPNGPNADKSIKDIFRCLSLDKNLLDELRRNQKKIVTVQQGKIITASEKIEDFFEYLKDQYYIKYTECFVPGRVF